jgi:tetratricopeptide (TPR) repeat protein
MLLGGLYRDDGNEEKSRMLVNELFNDPKSSITSKLIMLGTYNQALAQSRSNGKPDTNLEAFVIDLYNKLEQTDPADANVQLAGGDLFMSLDKPREAKARYLKSIRLGTSSYEAWQNLLYLENQEKQYDSVIMHAEEALEVFPNQSNIYYFNGYAHLRKRDFRNATNLLEQAKRLSKNNEQQVAEINSMLGDAYQAMKEYEKSAKAYDEALAFNPMNDIVLNNYSYYLSLRKADLEKAERMSSLLVKDHPDNISYLDTHAWVLYNREKYKEAKKVMERALSLDKPSAINFEHYGDILFQLGDVEEAVEQWRKAKSMGSLNQEIDKKIANRKIL